jgi:hypothetical protein
MLIFLAQALYQAPTWYLAAGLMVSSSACIDQIRTPHLVLLVWPRSQVFMYLWVDMYGGILHVVLDTPEFIPLPVLGEPCLEFQWHHLLPHGAAAVHILCSQSTCLCIRLRTMLYLCRYHQQALPGGLRRPQRRDGYS